MCTAESETAGRFAGQESVSEWERLKAGRNCRWQCAEVESEEWCAGVIYKE